MSVFRQVKLLDGSELDVLFVPNHKITPVAVPNVEQGKVIVEPICHNYASFEQWNIVCPFIISGLAISYIDVGWRFHHNPVRCAF